jgi:DNA polymerase III epsilon subunit-like protein
MFIAYDTETTGMPDFRARSADPAQPHLVQLALVTCDDAGAEVSAISVIIRPDSWIIPAEVTAIHGISQERAMDEGIAEELAVDMFIAAQGRAGLRVAHNESFDRRILRIAMTRAGLERDFIETIEARASYCTCVAAKLIVNLPPTEKMMAAGFKGAKPPKLEECIRHFFKEELAGGHDALVDARACARVYGALMARQAAGAAA